MAVAIAPGPTRTFPAYAGFAAVLSGAGLPIYIFAPKFYAESFGVSLTALGAVLFALRLIDVVQDPALGWIAERLGSAKARAVAGAGLLLSLSMLALFAVTPPIDPLWWFALSLIGLFSAFSFLTICFYAQGVETAQSVPKGHVRLAAWRETGALLGVCGAAVAPTVLGGWLDAPFAGFAWVFAGAVALAVLAMAPLWSGATTKTPPTPVSTILADPIARRLLLLALVNATPLAVSSTLFLFFVEDRLRAPGWEGPLLVLFFLAAALSAPVWSMLARRHGAKPVLCAAMVLAIASFGWVLTLEAGDVWPFAVICLLSGASIGADLTLLPALFASRLAVIAPKGGQGFGLWSFVSKLSLAFAAVLLLPMLDRAGFQTGADNSQASLSLLAGLYAVIPSVLKLIAIALLVATPLEEGVPE